MHVSILNNSIDILLIIYLAVKAALVGQMTTNLEVENIENSDQGEKLSVFSSGSDPALWMFIYDASTLDRVFTKDLTKM